jgi:hypothetical protein
MIDSNWANDAGMYVLPVGMTSLFGLVTRSRSWMARSLFSGRFGWDWVVTRSRGTDTCNEIRLALAGMKIRRQAVVIGSGGQSPG